MNSVALQSPGLQALMTAVTSSTAAAMPSMTLPNSTLPPTPSSFHGISSRPITGMSILQLASPHSHHQPAASHGGSMLPPPSPLIGGSMAPPPSPAFPTHPQSQQHSHTNGGTGSMTMNHTNQAAQAQLLALVAEGGRETRASRHQKKLSDGADDLVDLDEDESMAAGSDDEAEDGPYLMDGGESVSSRSCPPSPLQSLAMLSSDAGGSGMTSSVTTTPHSQRRSASKSLSSRRRSIGSHAEHRAHSTERPSTLTFKRPKVSLTAAAPGFKKSAKGDSAANSSGGSSCHQCKSRRNYADLTYCTSSLHKKNKNAVCRKKFCEHCLKKFYRETPTSAGPNSNILWSCPSCRKICCCAACRRREQREDDTPNGGMQSNDVTPMPTPLYRGEPEPASTNGNHLTLPSPHHSASSPSPLNMQRLLLSPPNTMSQLPPTASKPNGNGSLLHHQSSRLNVTPPGKQRSFSTSPISSSSLSSQSPPPLDTMSNGTTTYAQNIASLTALSQAAMRSPPDSTTTSFHHQPHSITVNLQNHLPMTTSSLVSSAVNSPNDGRAISNGSNGSGAGSATTVTGLLQSNIGTPKASSAGGSLYSNLLGGAGSVMLTPRLLPRASMSTTPMSSVSLMHKSPSFPLSLNASLAAAAAAATLTASSSTSANQDTSLSSSDLNDDSREMDEGGQSSQESVMTVLPSFALFYALGQLPSVQKDVHSVLSSFGDGLKNRDKLKKIEEIFFHYAEKVTNEEMPLQI